MRTDTTYTLLSSCSICKEYVKILIEKCRDLDSLTCSKRSSLLCQISNSIVEVVGRHTIMDLTEHLDRNTHRHDNIKYVIAILYRYFSLSVML